MTTLQLVSNGRTPAQHPHTRMELVELVPSVNFTNFMEVYQTESDDPIIDDDNLSKLHASIFGDSSASPSIIFMENAEEMLLPWKSNPNFVPIIITHVITFMVGLAGNIIVICTMSRGHGERSVTSMFLVSLAVADLLLVAVCAPLETMGYFLNPWTQGGSLCQLQSYVEMLSAVASVLNLTAVSLERYIVIVYPIKSRSFCTLRNCRRALIAVWIISLILTAPVILTRESVTYIYYNNVTTVAVHYCMDTADKGQDQGLGSYSSFLIAIYQLVIMLILPFLLMTICYSRVIKELWLSTKQITAMTRDYSNSRIVPAPNIVITPPHHRPINKLTPVRGSPSLWGPPHQDRLAPRIVQRTGLKSSKYSHTRSNDGAKQARKQVIKMLIMVVVLFLICWGPRLLLNAIIKWGLSSYNETVYQLRIFFNLMPFIHSCINPIIYSFMSSNFRWMMVRVRRRLFQWCCCSCCQSKAETHARPNSVVFEMGNGVGVRRQPSVYCVSSATTEATLAVTALRGSVMFQERSSTLPVEDN